MNELQELVAASVVGGILFICICIGILEYYSESRLFRRLKDEAIFRWKDASAEEISAAYVQACFRREEILDMRYEYSPRNDLEVEALIEGLEYIASARGYQLPLDDDILRQYHEEHQ